MEVGGEAGEHVFRCTVEEAVLGGLVGTVVDVDHLGSACRQFEVKEAVEKNSLSFSNGARASCRWLRRRHAYSGIDNVECGQ